MKLHTFLNFGGNCKEAFEFYEKHLGGKIVYSMTWDQSPTPNPMMPEGWEKALIYADMLIGDTQLMGSDVPGYQPVRSSYQSLSFNSSEETEKAFAALTEGGEVIMPLQETFYAYNFAMLRDKFGVLWMLLHQKPMQ